MRKNQDSNVPVRKTTIGKVLIGVGTVILTFSFLVQVALGIGTIRDADYVPRYLDEERYLSDLNYGSYVSLLDVTARDSRLDAEYTETERACRAVAMYYEAASLYRAYLEAGDDANAAKQAERMERFAGQTGEFSGHKDTIDEMFGIE